MEETLGERLLAHGLEKGTFTLASGRLSSVKLDVEKACRRDPDLLEGLVRVFHGWLENDLAAGPVHLGAVAGGGIPLVGAVMAVERALKRTSRLRAFTIHKNGRLEGTLPPPESTVVLVEDVVTSGGTVIRAATALRQAVPALSPDLRVFAVADWEAGGRRNLSRNGLLLEAVFRMPHHFGLHLT